MEQERRLDLDKTIGYSAEKDMKKQAGSRVVTTTKGHMRDGKNHSKRVMFWLSTALCRGALRRKQLA
ncbi:TPA: hypothetical protein RVR74_000428 [Aeromonas salmonicida]|uniref:hypothetical protein n=1 Tax=Aeromonas salmonicida TaxID=645 RepID=UPI001F15A144|nr:hypothetical protein [Aeromonas salmonicida]MCE9936384.1 hypothetical protein [Aeromonas salmonicida]MDR7018258.1 hypothetical protein [Aeromonas salmonicida]HEA3088149.1 hypothetical protein [Aeromonas salmonicida]